MADTIDVDKLKNDAFDAIDALFNDEDEDRKTSFEAEAEPLESKKTSSDDFDMLEEFSLALDWEYSDKEINRFLDRLDSIAANNTDKYNQALIKMLKSIVNYLQKAKNKAFPQTMAVMSSVINTLKTTNNSEFNKALIKDEVSAAYQKVVILKQKISEYNEELRARAERYDKGKEPEKDFFEQEAEPEETPVQAFESMPEETGETDDVETIYSYELLEADPAGEKEAEDLFSGVDVDQTDFILEDEPEPEDAVPQVPAGTGGSILDRLAGLEARVDDLEKQNRRLRQLMIDQHQGQDSFDVQDSGTDMEPSSAFDTQGPFSPIETPVTVDVNEISYTSSPADDTGFSEDLFTTEADYEDDTPMPLDDMDYETGETKEDFIEYVRFFTIDQQVVALPNEYINNIYKIPSGIRKTIHTMTSIELKKLASVFQKLSSNMKGTLQEVPADELNEMTTQVKTLGGEDVSYRYAVLCSCDNTSVIVPVTGQHKTRLTLATGMNKTPGSSISEYSIDVEDLGTVPLVIPC